MESRDGQIEQYSESSKILSSFAEGNSENQLGFGKGFLDDVECRLPDKHNEAFVDELWKELSPIGCSSPALQKKEEEESTISTQNECKSACSKLKRSVKRRRRSMSTSLIKASQRKRSNHRYNSEKSTYDQSVDPGNCKVSFLVGENSMDEILSAEKTVIPNSLPSSPVRENSELLHMSSSSLANDAQLNFNLTTTMDELLMSNDINLTCIEDDNGSKKDVNCTCNSLYGLPEKVNVILQQERGIQKLYDWQNDCLSLPALEKRKNLIYSLPTSGGKTLVAEILIMKELQIREKNAILLLPYVSIVQEKVRAISPFAVGLGFHVEEYAGVKGAFPPRNRRKRKSLYIATIEKGDAIINNLIENDRIKEIGLIVVDELHMIGEGGGRGARLEMCLTKVLYSNAEIQIIGMSATLGNPCDLQTFLSAEIYCNDFRPIELSEHLKLGDTIFAIDQKKIKIGDNVLEPLRKICHPKTWDKKAQSMDPDHLTALALEVVPNNSCLIFCPTKKNCENVAVLLAKCMPSSLKAIKQLERQKLLTAIHATADHIDTVLRKTIPFGIAYHHSGLTMDERKLIEDAYSAGVLCLLCCTSTLAAGVNLPAKRVILRAPYIGNKFLTKSRYNQMIGRAGRTGIDSSGESIMLIQPKDKSKVLELLKSSVDNCYSSLDYDESKGLRSFILNSIGLKLCSTTYDIEGLLKKTLFYVQASKKNDFVTETRIRTEVERLIDEGFIQSRSSSDDAVLSHRLEPTKIGIATYKGCLDIDKAHSIYDELVRGAKSLALSTELHLLYLITPLESIDIINVDWRNYYQHIMKLSSDELRTAETIGISESFMIRKAAGQSCRKDAVDEFVVRRFLLTLMIYQYLKETPIWRIAEMFDVTRGFIQGLMTSVGSFTYMLVNFTKELPEFWAYSLLFEGMLQKLSHAATAELAPLMEIPGVKQARARQLYKAGYHTLKDLAWANANDLCQNIDHMPRKQANLIVFTAKMMLQEKAESLKDEAEEMMMKQQK